jgi:hypothetical protein
MKMAIMVAKIQCKLLARAVLIEPSSALDAGIRAVGLPGWQSFAQGNQDPSEES